MYNYYEILGIDTKSDKLSIKKAYREKAMHWHPDRNKSANAHEEFIRINEAYNILIDDHKRSVYDALLEEFINQIRNPSVYTKPKENQKYTNWVKEEREKASKLASISYNQFVKGLTKVIEQSVNVAYYGCAFYVAICFIIAAFISLVDATSQFNDGKLSGGILILQFVWSGIFFASGFFWIVRMSRKKR